MKFELTATITTTREVTGTINVTKKDLVDAGYPSVEDNDSTAWYGYVAEFLESEFSSSEYGYTVNDINIIDDVATEDLCEDIDINW
tara:strand:- start:295 stop:552 length:258 start_codon:yes stop_codon:yes gene_type:complete